MTYNTTSRFVIRMKLRELQRQRDRLRVDYKVLREQADSVTTPGKRLARLYEGLRTIRYAGKPLHPEIANLDLILQEAEAQVLPSSLLTLWQERMEKELLYGQQRSEFGYPVWLYSTGTVRAGRSRAEHGTR